MQDVVRGQPLNRDGFVVGFDDVFKGFKTLAAIGVIPAGTGAVRLRYAGACALAFQMRFDVFIAKGVAQADIHTLIFVLKVILSYIFILRYFYLYCKSFSLFLFCGGGRRRASVAAL